MYKIKITIALFYLLIVGSFLFLYFQILVYKKLQAMTSLKITEITFF